MKKCYLLLGLMALTSLLLICNSVLADEQNSEDDRWEALEDAAVVGTAEAGSLIGVAAAEAASAEIVDQRIKYYEDYMEIIRYGVRFGVTDPKDQVDVNEKSLDQPATQKKQRHGGKVDVTEESPDQPALGLN